jgi:hypothetical protein
MSTCVNLPQKAAENAHVQDGFRVGGGGKLKRNERKQQTTVREEA